MPQVRVYQGPQVSENQLPGNRVSGTPGQVIGAAQENAARLTGAVAKMAGGAADVLAGGMVEQAKVDATQAIVELQEASKQRMLDMQANEVGAKAEGLRDTHAKWFGEAAQKVGGKLKDQYARSLFDAKSQEIRLRHFSEVDAHSFREKQKYDQAVFASAVASNGDLYLSATTNENEALALNDIIALVQDKLKGQDTATTDKAIRDVLSPLIVDKAGKYLKIGKPDDGLAYLQNMRDTGLLSEGAFEKAKSVFEKESAGLSGYVFGKSNDSVAAARREAEKRFGVGTDLADAMVNGAKRAVGEREEARKFNVSKLVTQAERLVLNAKGDPSVVPDSLISKMADPANGEYGVDAALRFTEAKNRALDNKAQNGEPYAKTTNTDKYFKALNAIAAGDIKSHDELQVYVPFLTKTDFGVIDRALKDKALIDPNEVNASFERYSGKKPKDDAKSFSLVYQELLRQAAGGKPVDIDAVVRSYYVDRVAGDKRVKAELAGEEYAAPEMPEDYGEGLKDVPKSMEKVWHVYVDAAADAVDNERKRLASGTLSAAESKAANTRIANARALLVKAQDVITRLQKSGDLADENVAQEFYQKHGYDYEDWIVRHAVSGVEHNTETLAIYSFLRELGVADPTADDVLGILNDFPPEAQ